MKEIQRTMELYSMSFKQKVIPEIESGITKIDLILKNNLVETSKTEIVEHE